MTKGQKKILIAAVALIFVVCGFWQLNKINKYSSSHFLENTIVNQVDLSGMTMEDAKAALTEAWNAKTFDIIREGSSIATIEHLDFTYDIGSQLEDIMLQPLYKRIFYYVTKKDQNLTITMTAQEETEAFKEQVDALKFLNRKYKVKTKDAYVDLSNRKFEIIKEVQGDNIDKGVFRQAVLSAIAEGTFSLEYVEEDYYAQPKVLSTDEDLLAYQEYCIENLSQKITYEFYNEKYTLTPLQLSKMVKVQEGKRIVDEEAVAEFVQNLAKKRNTLGTQRSFQSTYRGTITVSGGTYGYVINQGKEAKALIKNLKSGEDISREPKYSQTPYYGGGGSSDIGTSYVEIDLANQHLFLYQNGRKIMDCPVVTGSLKDGLATPRGVFYLVYKSKDAVLKGSNVDGSKYETPVKYWMPFYGGYGMHDASWRKDFGGSIYKSGGSHGCVNMPVASAELLYNNIVAGYPVVVH